jgi:hypothetical protein
LESKKDSNKKLTLIKSDARPPMRDICLKVDRLKAFIYRDVKNAKIHQNWKNSTKIKKFDKNINSTKI